MFSAVLPALAASCNGSIVADGSSTGSVAGGSSTGGSSTVGDAGTGAAEAGLCSAVWGLVQPIQPRWRYAGLDWDGLTIDSADRTPQLCPSKPLGAFGACPSGNGTCNENAWGDANEVRIVWNVATRVVDQVQLRGSYTGKMTTVFYPDHAGEMHGYSLGVGDVIRRDDLPFEIQWNDPQTRAVQITDIFNAAMATYAEAAGVPFDTDSCMKDTDCAAPGTVSVCECAHAIDPTTMKPTIDCDTTKTLSGGQCGIADCGSDGNCLIDEDGSTTIFGIQPLRVYFQGAAAVAQPALSTPQVIYGLAYSK